MNRRLLLILAASLAKSALCFAAPIRAVMPIQKLAIEVKRTKGTAVVLKEGLKANVLTSQLQWDYIANSSISVPYIDVKLTGIPIPNNFTVLAERSGNLKPDPTRGYVIRLPLLSPKASLLITLVDISGQFEDWRIEVNLGILESAIFVDENCSKYVFRLKETQRPGGPNLLFVGCRPGTGPRDVSLDILWADVENVQYMGQTIQANQSIVTVPLESTKTSDAELIGNSLKNGKNIFQVHYEPYVPLPFEVWTGFAFYRSSFFQSNFDSKYLQNTAALLAQFWYRPEDSRLNAMFRGFGTLGSFQQTLTPVAGYREEAVTWFLDVELRYAVVDTNGWRVDPLLGGWFFFMDVASRSFGIQRIINPVIGVFAQKEIGKRDAASLTFRFVPLQSFFNPFAFSINNSYFEWEATFTHALRQRNKVFGTIYFGTLAYTPEGMAQTLGTYLVVGGGIAW